MNPWDQFVGLFTDGLEALADSLAFLGDHRWAAAIVLLTIIVKTLLLPLAIKQVRSTQAMQRLQPEIQRLQKKYKNDRARLAQEQQDLWKREGINPLSCMLPMLTQMPIFFAIYYTIRNLSDREDLVMPFLGIGDLTQKATDNLLGAGGLLMALMVVSQIVTMKQTSVGQNPQQQRMFMIMPIFFAFVMLQFPVALVLYWATQNLYQLVQQRLMLGRFTKPEDISTKAIQKGVKGSPNGSRMTSKTPAKTGQKKNRNAKRRSR